MNTILEQINSTGYRFVEFALPMLIQSCLLIVVLLLADLLLRKRVRAVIRYWLWMLVLIKLILPTTLSSPLSLGYWFGDELARVKASNTNTFAPPTNLPEITVTETSAATDIPPAVTTVTPPQVTVPTAVKAETLPAESPVTLTRQGTVFLVWIAVVSTMGLLLLQRVIFVRGLVAQAKNPTEIMKDTFRFCCRQMGLKSKVSLKVSANTASPAVCGLFRPVILVPENLAPTLGVGHLRIVLMHELAHIKRGDLLINLAQTVLQIIYFYNPLLWLANSVIRRIREQAVDEAVQVAMGTKAGQYPQTLIDVAKIAFNRPVLSLRLIGVVESKSALKGRIKRMLDRPIPKTAKLGTLGLISLLIFAAVFLPMAKAAKPKRVDQHPIGNWQSVDFVRKIEYFEPGEKKWNDDLYLKGLEFYKGGTTSGPWTWKKGYLWHPDDRTKARYIIKELGGKRYLFMEWMSGDVTIRGQKPWYYVMKDVRDDKKDNYAELNEGVTVEEGVGFDDIIVGDIKCTGEFIKAKLGEPDKEVKDKKDWWINYRKKYGLDFWLNPQENTLYEIRLNKGFKGKLRSGISMSSTKQDVFDIYGKPIRKEVVEDLHQRFDNRVLLFRKPAWINRWRKPYYAKIHYNEEGLLFWFDGDAISQIVISNQQCKEEKFKTTLDNGVTVELIGVCDYPKGEARCWRPDGSKSQEQIYATKWNKQTPQPNEFGIILKLDGPEDLSFAWKEIDGSEGYEGSCRVMDDQGNQLENFTAAIADMAEKKTTTMIRIGIATEPWRTEATHSGRGMTTTGSKNILFSQAFETNSFIGLTVSSQWLKDRQCRAKRIVAVDTKGQVHTTKNIGSVASGEIDQMTAKFQDLKLKDIAEFQFQTRPYQWVTFNNVSLKPGHKTDVQVEAEDTKLLQASFIDANGRVVDKLIVPGVRVGNYTFDMSKDDVLKTLGKPKVIFYGEERYTLDNLPRTYYMCFDDVSFRILDDSVKEITVLSPFYKFTNGLGVGNSEQKIKQAFGDDFHLEETEWKDFLTYEDEGLVFEIHKNNRTVMEINVLNKVRNESLKYEPTKIKPKQNPLNEAVYKQLDQIVDLSGLTPDMSFERALDELKYSIDPPLKTFIDWQDLYDNADIDQSTQTNMDAIPSIRLGTALKLLLKAVSNDFAKLDYTVEDGIICIATIESTPAKLETIIYNVSDLANKESDAVHLTQLIISTVEPDRWYNKGGEGTISAYNERLIVHQTPEIHKRIQGILQDLRKSQAGKK